MLMKNSCFIDLKEVNQAIDKLAFIILHQGEAEDQWETNKKEGKNNQIQSLLDLAIDFLKQLERFQKVLWEMLL